MGTLQLIGLTLRKTEPFANICFVEGILVASTAGLNKRIENAMSTKIENISTSTCSVYNTEMSNNEEYD